MDFSTLCFNENASSSVSSNSSTTSSTNDYYSLFGNGNCFSEQTPINSANSFNFSTFQPRSTAICAPTSISQSSSVTSVASINQHNMFNDILPPIPTQQSQQADNLDRKKLFVGNLPANTTLQELIELFGKFGRVNERLSVVKEDNYAFIHFYSDLDAHLAYNELNDSFFKNRYIRVQYSVSNAHMKKSKSKIQTYIDFLKNHST
jgi:hypothetical protein